MGYTTEFMRLVCEMRHGEVDGRWAFAKNGANTSIIIED